MSSNTSKNNVSIIEIASLSSPEYNKVEKFLVEKGFSKAKASEVEIKKYLEAKNILISDLQAKETVLEIESKKQLMAAEELQELRSAEESEKAISELSSQITEINRYLAEFKMRCSQLKIDLSQVTIEFLTKETKNTDNEISQVLKLQEILTHLVDVSRAFEQYNKEEALRNQINEVKKTIQDLIDKVERVSKAKAEVEMLKRRFPREIQDYIYQNLDNELFNKIYRSLDPHRRFQSIKLGVNVFNGKLGINLEASNQKVKARPEFTFSSGQLNTLGVSIFLSMALRQNWLKLNTILLDDPIQNLDDINVLALIDMIRSLFDARTGKQIIMSTHDERFYQLVRKKFVDYKIKCWRFESYGQVVAD